jgi:DNA polymerase/3'-5' exonuclease PolX
MKAQPLPLATASAFAHNLINKMVIAKVVDREEIAGSIRRQRPFVNDIDIVIIPRIEPIHDLTGHVIAVKNHWHNWMLNAVATNTDRLRWVTGATNPVGSNYQVEVLKDGRVHYQVDFFIATPADFGAVLLCRTGSKEHNIWLCEQAKLLGGKYEGAKGYRDEHFTLHSETEEAIYTALGLPFIKPENREAEYLQKELRK